MAGGLLIMRRKIIRQVTDNTTDCYERKKPSISGYFMKAPSLSSQNLSSIFISFAANEKARLVYTEKDPRHFFLLHDLIYADRGGRG